MIDEQNERRYQWWVKSTQPATQSEVRETEQIQIQVTETDIRKGKCANSLECAVALALQRSFLHDENDHRASVALDITDNKWAYVGSVKGITVDLPETAQQWIKRYDANLPVEPFTFTVDVPAGIREVR